MSAIFKSILLLFVFLAFQTAVAEDYSSKNKRAVKAYKEALDLFKSRQYSDFFEKVDAAIAEDSTFTEAYLLAMQASVEKLYEKKAIYYGEKAFRLNPTLHPPLTSILGKLYLRDGQYDKAIECFNFYIEKNPNQRAKVDEWLDKALFAKHIKDNPVSFVPKNMGDSINSKFDDYWPSISGDGNVFVKTSNIPREDNPDIYQEDFFVSKKDSLGRWGKVKSLPGSINTLANEGAQSLTANGQGMYFTICVNECNIYFSKLKNGVWSEPQKLPTPINSPISSDKQPSISADGRYLFFTSNRGGGYGGYDLYVATRDMETGEWINVKNLGPKVNTPKNDVAPFIHFDGQTLYFASDGHKGLGGLDLFITRLDANGEWTTPVNLGYPINTNGEEQGIIISSDARTTYIASNREEGKGLDIYSFELPDMLKPQVSYYLKGVVVDAKTKRPLAAEIVLANLKTGKEEFVSSSDPEDGNFFTSLPAATSYALQVTKKGYLFNSQSFMLDSSKTIQNPLELKIELEPISVGSSTILRNIYFDVNSYHLKPESEVELSTLIKLLNSNPTLWIEISGHTDSSGSQQFNNTLSTNRAKEVVQYLVSKGIDKNRLRAAGYGSSKPIAPNDNVENKAKNRRTEFMVIYK
jgi:outer membrane protein OmpA-like peptidoglycan-associated protein